MFRRIVLDTNIYIDWLNRGLRDELVMGRGYARYLSAIVLMELRVGARTGRPTRALNVLARGYQAGTRLIAPSVALLDDAGSVLARLRGGGREIRHASLVHDVLIALTCRALGATLITANEDDFSAIRRIRDFGLEVVSA